ncbi:uncharacterized protein LOC106162606 [Lingula anatina]|uniref:Uncharacterized protein LOC106162606 n=1 Tax=Lingula anatina TaxID=7574 RepID=A0A1S3IAV1_LINAN|nr:uncharacterized protein LOC106162606 [Lingula anatina]|eukprot:XP_013395387.1 uncharacterized protein LOC106162606 [Lingula anatina]
MGGNICRSPTLICICMVLVVHAALSAVIPGYVEVSGQEDYETENQDYPEDLLSDGLDRSSEDLSDLFVKTMRVPFLRKSRNMVFILGLVRGENEEPKRGGFSINRG